MRGHSEEAKRPSPHDPLQVGLDRLRKRFGQSPDIAACAAASGISPVHTQRFRNTASRSLRRCPARPSQRRISRFAAALGEPPSRIGMR